MAVATRKLVSKKSDISRKISATPSPPVRVHQQPKAPDRGGRDHEAPDAGDGHQVEAPDAGDGRMNTLEHEFTEGRSQS